MHPKELWYRKSTRIWHWALLAHHEALPDSDSAPPAALSHAVGTSPVMPHDSGTAQHPLMPWLLPSPSPSCLDLPGTPQGAVGEILSPWVPKENILCHPRALPALPSLGARTDGDRSPPSPLPGAASPLGDAQCWHHHPCAEEPQHGWGWQAACQPHRERFYLPHNSPSSPPVRDSGDAPRHHPHPATKGLACG